MPGAVLVEVAVSRIELVLLFSAGLFKKSNTEPEPPSAGGVLVVVSAGVVDQVNLGISVGGFAADSDGGGLPKILLVGGFDVQGKDGGCAFEAELFVEGVLLVLDAWMNGLLDISENGFLGAESRTDWFVSVVAKPLVVGGLWNGESVLRGGCGDDEGVSSSEKLTSTCFALGSPPAPNPGEPVVCVTNMLSGL